MTKRGKQASRKAAARKIGFLEVPISLVLADAGYGDETTHAKRQPFPKITFPALQRAQRYVHSDRPIQHLRLSVALASAS